MIETAAGRLVANSKKEKSKATLTFSLDKNTIKMFKDLETYKGVNKSELLTNLLEETKLKEIYNNEKQFINSVKIEEAKAARKQEEDKQKDK